MKTWCAMFAALVPSLPSCVADTVARPDTFADDSDLVEEVTPDDGDVPDEADTVDDVDTPHDSDTLDDSDTTPDSDTDGDTDSDTDSDTDGETDTGVEPVSYTWTPVTLEAAFAPRDGAGAVSLGGRMWLLGGWNPLDPTHFPAVTNSEVWSSADGLDWTLELLEAPWEGRHTAGYDRRQDLARGPRYALGRCTPVRQQSESPSGAPGWRPRSGPLMGGNVNLENQDMRSGLTLWRRGPRYGYCQGQWGSPRTDDVVGALLLVGARIWKPDAASLGARPCSRPRRAREDHLHRPETAASTRCVPRVSHPRQLTQLRDTSEGHGSGSQSGPS